MMWLPDDEKIDETFTRFDTIHERDGQTDRQTDGQTPHDGIGRTIQPCSRRAAKMACS